MSLENIVETDLLVIGGGMAGSFAAIKAREQGLDVILVDKGYVGKSGATAFAGGYFIVFHPEWGHDMNAWVEQISKVGEYLNNRQWTEIVLKDSYARYRDLVSWGVRFVEENGKLLKHHTPPVLESINMWRREYTPVIRKQTLKVGVKILDRIMVTELLKNDGRVVGAVGFHTWSGDLYIFKAKATVLAAGSGSFKQAGLPIAYWTSDGEGMAYRAGLEITGKEFYMGNLVGTMADYPAWRGHGMAPARFKEYVNAEGEALDAVNRYHKVFEVHAGRAPIYWNLDAATAEDIREMRHHQQATGTLKETERIGLDLTHGGKVPMVGGIWLGASVNGGSAGVLPANTNCATALPGLYAAGDCCAIRQVGTVYPGTGFGLCGAAVTGARAGLGAAEYALKAGKVAVDGAELAGLKKTMLAPAERKGGFSPRWVTQVLQNLMVPYFIWQVKHGERMQAALTIIEFMGEHLVPMLTARDAHELRLAHETRNMVLNAEMMLRASIIRTESRGTHYREDYPRRDDPGWLAWVKLKREEGRMKISKEPIPSEWWPDLSRPYNERYPMRFPGE